MRLSKLVQSVDGAKIIWKGETEREIDGLTADSRQRSKNALFFCLTGGEKDGHDFVEEALKNGAVALVTERNLPTSVPQVLVKDSREALALMSAKFYGEPSERLKVIGVTGTNGKTTTAHMLAAILEADGKKTGVIGTLGAFYNGKKTDCELTTPDPIFLQKLLSQMAADGVEYVVMEASAHALYYKKTAGIRFAACIFTNFTQDHLDFFSTMRAYKQAKSRLFDDADIPLAVLNGDDETGREFGEIHAKKLGRKTTYYGLNTPADAFAVITDETLLGTECMLNINDGLCRVSLGVTGRHNVYNALAAAACAVGLGVPLTAVSKGLTAFKGAKGRLERVGEYRGADIFVDFAHTPDGLEKSLETLKKHCKGRLVCLFGCGGNRDKTKRPLMGEVAAKKADFSVLTSDNPRYEEPLDIIADIEKGYRRFSVKYVIVPERKRALEYALDFLQKGDILLVAGKGGEEEQELMGIKYAFNDNDIIEKIIKEKEEHFLN